MKKKETVWVVMNSSSGQSDWNIISVHKSSNEASKKIRMYREFLENQNGIFGAGFFMLREEVLND